VYTFARTRTPTMRLDKHRRAARRPALLLLRPHRGEGRDEGAPRAQCKRFQHEQAATCNLQPATRSPQPSLPRRRAAKAGPSQSNPVQVSPTTFMTTSRRPTCHRDVRKCIARPIARPSFGFVIQFAQMPVFNRNNNNNRINMLFLKKSPGPTQSK